MGGPRRRPRPRRRGLRGSDDHQLAGRGLVRLGGDDGEIDLESALRDPPGPDAQSPAGILESYLDRAGDLPPLDGDV